MRSKSHLLVTGLAVFSLVSLGSCTTGIPSGGTGGSPQISGDFDLTQDGVGTFQVLAGEPVERPIRGSFSVENAVISSGSVALDPASITVTPAAGPTKGTAAMQVGEPLIVTVKIAPEDEIGTVCDSGETYGPFTVVLDENFFPVSIDPSTVTLTQNTVDLVNLGVFSLCLIVESPVDGTVTIDTLTFNLQ